MFHCLSGVYEFEIKLPAWLHSHNVRISLFCMLPTYSSVMFLILHSHFCRVHLTILFIPMEFTTNISWVHVKKLGYHLYSIQYSRIVIQINIGNLVTRTYRRVLLEKLTAQVAKKLPTFHGTQRFIKKPAGVRHWPLSLRKWIPSTAETSHLILPLHVCQLLPRDPSASDFPTVNYAATRGYLLQNFQAFAFLFEPQTHTHVSVWTSRDKISYILGPALNCLSQAADTTVLLCSAHNSPSNANGNMQLAIHKRRVSDWLTCSYVAQLRIKWKDYDVTVFWVLPPGRLLTNSSDPACCFHLLKIKCVCYSETSVPTYKTTRCLTYLWTI
jgi:hypothetical protein